jgi:hypothetical protein
MWPPLGDRAERTRAALAGPLCRCTKATLPFLGLESRPSTMRRFSDFQFLFKYFKKFV